MNAPVSAPTPRSRENAESKGRRYLLEGRLTVEAVTPGGVRASCRGSGHVWRCGYDAAADAFWCACPARGRCSHLVALGLVVAVAPVEGAAA